jgi:haloacetate dehalogenase
MEQLDFPGFETRRIPTSGGDMFAYVGPGNGPPVLLLHGFPETALMWREIAPLLSADLTVVAADLPGYGESACPAGAPDHYSMSKRAMAATLVEAMHDMGHDRFALVGHDRGGRVAYRAALDRPEAVSAFAVLDVLPIADVWDRADARFALSFWPFSLLAQPEPLPERLIAGAPEAIVDDALSNWGTPPETFPAEIRRAYVRTLRDPAHVHAICEEYRAAAGIDRSHDESDRNAGRRIACPVLALWSSTGALAEWYQDDSGPLGVWRRWANDVRGQPVEGGHFFPEEQPRLTAELIRQFLLKGDANERRTDSGGRNEVDHASTRHGSNRGAELERQNLR